MKRKSKLGFLKFFNFEYPYWKHGLSFQSSFSFGDMICNADLISVIDVVVYTLWERIA